MIFLMGNLSLFMLIELFAIFYKFDFSKLMELWMPQSMNYFLLIKWSTSPDFAIKQFFRFLSRCLYDVVYM